MNDIPLRKSRSVRRPVDTVTPDGPSAGAGPLVAGADGDALPAPVARRSAAVPMAQEFVDPETGKPLRRRSRKEGSDNIFDVPQKMRRPGWDYQWFTMRVMGEAVDGSVHVDIADGAWRAVKPDELPGYMPAGYDGGTIDRKGQRLYKRPEHISAEARLEARQAAQQQKADKFRQAQMTDPAGNGANQAPRSNTNVSMDYQPLPAAPGELQEIY